MLSGNAWQPQKQCLLELSNAGDAISGNHRHLAPSGSNTAYDQCFAGTVFQPG